MKIGICEDAVFVQEELTQLINEFETNIKREIFVYHSGEDMLNSGVAFDLVFLDIELPGISGLDVAEALQMRDYRTIIVFVSMYPKYVTRSYRLHTFQFLLKPLDHDVFKEEFKRCLQRYREHNQAFIFNYEGKEVKVLVGAIRFIESEGRQVVLHLKNGQTYRAYLRIGVVEEQLRGLQFARCHKSYLVNLFYVTDVEKKEVAVKGDENVAPCTLPLGVNYKNAFKESYHRYLIGQ